MLTHVCETIPTTRIFHVNFRNVPIKSDGYKTAKIGHISDSALVMFARIPKCEGLYTVACYLRVNLDCVDDAVRRGTAVSVG